MERLKCIVVDDENLARKLLEENIKLLPFLELVAMCKNPFEAMEILQSQHIDLMFLDIQMPGMLGTKFLQTLYKKPMVVLVTAYANYALEGYELDVIDYIMKPVSTERFTKAAHKALAEKEKNNQNVINIDKNTEKSNDLDSFFVHADYALVKIITKDITHVEGMKDYVKIFLSGTKKPVITKHTLKGIEEKLPNNLFLRVHKSFIVNLNKIESIRSQQISIGEHLIPVSDGNLETLMKIVLPKE